MATTKKRMARIGIIATAFIMILAIGVMAWAATLANGTWKFNGSVTYKNDCGVSLTAGWYVAKDDDTESKLSSYSYTAGASAVNGSIELYSSYKDLWAGEAIAIEIKIDTSSSRTIGVISATKKLAYEVKLTEGQGHFSLNIFDSNIATSGEIILSDSSNLNIYVLLTPKDTPDSGDWSSAVAFEITVTFAVVDV